MSGVVLKVVSAENGDKKESAAEDISFSDLAEAQQTEWLRFREFLKRQLCPPHRAR